MGTIIEVQVRNPESEDKANNAISAAFDEAERINQKYSTYIEDNLMAKLNNPKAKSIKVDKETFKLLKKCDTLNKLTKGGFDPAVGNLIDLLGFEKQNPKLPSDDSVKAALKKVGWKNIELRENNIYVKEKPVKLNFGAVAKGYAVDRAYEIMQSKGIEEFLINLGGEIKAKGTWSVGVQHPREQGKVYETLEVTGRAVATSGDYEQYFEEDKKRYTHILNPVTGYPADKVQSVTIVGDEVLTADALTTGFFVLEPEKSIEITETLEDIESLIIGIDGKRYQSSGFDKYIRR
jgi:thiamine biosynthesis lipoprotein